MTLRENLEKLKALRQRAMETASGAAFGARLRRLRKAKGFTLQTLSDVTGIAKSYLSQVETGYVRPPREEKIGRLAEALGAQAEEMMRWAHATRMPSDMKEQMRNLASAFDSAETVIRRLLARVAAGERGADAEQTQEGEIDLEALEESGLLEQIGQWGGLVKEKAGIRQIPVINKVAAGYPEEFTDLDYPAGIADEYIGASVELTDPNAFAVHVVGDSMAPKYREGDIVIFSPAEEVRSGDDCFVRFHGQGDGASTFKRLYFDTGDHVRLQPLNDAYAPTILKSTQVERVYKAVARYERL